MQVKRLECAIFSAYQFSSSLLGGVTMISLLPKLEDTSSSNIQPPKLVRCLKTPT
jgi:hypothetical protein